MNEEELKKIREWGIKNNKKNREKTKIPYAEKLIYELEKK